MKNEDIELDISIDPNELDREWISQPKLYFRYASMLADAKRDLDAAKVELDLTQAELDQSIRSDPEAFDIGKVTEAAIKAAIPTQKEYRKAAKALSNAKHLVDVLTAAVGALDHRKTALSKLVDLFLASYFAKPKASENARERMEDVERRSIRRGRMREE